MTTAASTPGRTVLHGVNVAMTTPFTEGSEDFDPGRFCSHIDFLLDAGVHGIVLNSGTGEFVFQDGIPLKPRD